jgi:hypothetical protein
MLAQPQAAALIHIDGAFEVQMDMKIEMRGST